jgi:hypothetical protein
MAAAQLNVTKESTLLTARRSDWLRVRIASPTDETTGQAKTQACSGPITRCPQIGRLTSKRLPIKIEASAPKATSAVAPAVPDIATIACRVIANGRPRASKTPPSWYKVMEIATRP